MLEQKQNKILEDLPSLVAPIKPESVEMEPKTSKTSPTFPFEILAAGTYGCIALGKVNNENCIVKIINFTSDEKQKISLYQNGMRNILNVQLERLVKPFFDYYKEYKKIGENESILSYFQVMPYIKGKDLFEFIKEDKVISSKQRNKIALQIAQGLNDMHKHKLIHCDFKLKNILIESSTQDIYICDFDFTIAEKQQHSLKVAELL